MKFLVNAEEFGCDYSDDITKQMKNTNTFKGGKERYFLSFFKFLVMIDFLSQKLRNRTGSKMPWVKKKSCDLTQIELILKNVCVIRCIILMHNLHAIMYENEICTGING